MKQGFMLVEMLVALGLMLILAMAGMTLIVNQNNALTHFNLRAEMANLMLASTVSGSVCKSVQTAGGVPPLGVCGTATTPQTIDLLYADGTRVDAGSKWLLRADCHMGYYAVQIKSTVAAKVDPFNKQALTTFLEPLAVRFGMAAWTGVCP